MPCVDWQWKCERFSDQPIILSPHPNFGRYITICVMIFLIFNFQQNENNWQVCYQVVWGCKVICYNITSQFVTLQCHITRLLCWFNTSIFPLYCSTLSFKLCSSSRSSSKTSASSDSARWQTVSQIRRRLISADRCSYVTMLVANIPHIAHISGATAPVANISHTFFWQIFAHAKKL